MEAKYLCLLFILPNLICCSARVPLLVDDSSTNAQGTNITYSHYGSGFSQAVREKLLGFDPGFDVQWNTIEKPKEVDQHVMYDQRHLRYVMASTAEQPDSGVRTSNLNIWLTVLIAAVAAAILS